MTNTAKKTLNFTLSMDVEVSGNRQPRDVLHAFLNAIAAEYQRQHPEGEKGFDRIDFVMGLMDDSGATTVVGGLPLPIFEHPEAIAVHALETWSRRLTALVTEADLSDEDGRAMFRAKASILFNATPMERMVEIAAAVGAWTKAPKNNRAAAERIITDALINRFRP